MRRMASPEIEAARAFICDEAATMRSQGYSWRGAAAELIVKHAASVDLATGATPHPVTGNRSHAIPIDALARIVRDNWQNTSLAEPDTREASLQIQLRAYDTLLAALHRQLGRFERDASNATDEGAYIRDVAPTVDQIRKILKERALLLGLGRDPKSAEAIVEAAVASLANRISSEGGRVRSRSRRAARTIDAEPEL